MKNYSVNELTKMFWKSIILIIILALIGGACLGFLAKKKRQTTYTATRSVIVTHNLNHYLRTNNSENPQQNIVNIDQNMMPTYEEVAENERVTSGARKYLSKSMQAKYSANDVNSDVSAKSHPQSLVLKIKAKTKSANASVAIANATARSFKKELPRIQPGAGTVVLLAKANKNNVTSETTPHAKKYAAVGVALGGLVGIIISFSVITLKDIAKKNK